MLKLLNPTQANAEVRNRSQADASKAIDAQKRTVEVYKQLTQADKDFQETLERNRKIWVKEEGEHREKMELLTKKVEKLEARRKNALIPLTTRQKELDTIASALSVREQKVLENEALLEEKIEMLAQRLDEVSEREQSLDDVSEALSKRERGVVQQSEEVKQRSEEFVKSLIEIHRNITEEHSKIDTRRKELWTKENNLIERERIVQKKDENMTNREKALQDKYLALHSAMAEIKRKYNV